MKVKEVRRLMSDVRRWEEERRHFQWHKHYELKSKLQKMKKSEKKFGMLSYT